MPGRRVTSIAEDPDLEVFQLYYRILVCQLSSRCRARLKGRAPRVSQLLRGHPARRIARAPRHRPERRVDEAAGPAERARVPRPSARLEARRVPLLDRAEEGVRMAVAAYPLDNGL